LSKSSIGRTDSTTKKQTNLDALKPAVAALTKRRERQHYLKSEEDATI
jgi:hypothetical protein